MHPAPLLDIISKPHRLETVQDGEDQVFLFPGEGALGVYYSGASVKVVLDKAADRFRITADYIEIFGQVQTLDKSVYHGRADGKSQEGVESGLDTEDETACQGDEEIGDKKCFPDVNAGIFLQDHGDDVCTAAGRADIEKNCGSQSRKGDGEGQLQHRLVRERAVHGADPFQKRQGYGEQDAAVCSLRGKILQG